jgi:hypothetical protein
MLTIALTRAAVLIETLDLVVEEDEDIEPFPFPFTGPA